MPVGGKLRTILPRAGESSQGVIGGSDAAGHTPEQLKTMREYQKATDSKLMEFIKKVRGLKDVNVASKIRHEISPLSKEQVRDIKDVSGIDTTGYTHVIKGDGVIHINNRHGKNGQHDQSMANDADIARIPYVLDNYDSIDILLNDKGQPVVDYKTLNKDGSPAQLLQITKRVDGTYFVIEAVPDNARKQIIVKSAYISKANQKGTQQDLLMPESSGPQLTSETSLARVPKATITQGSMNGNREIPRRMPVDGKLRTILPRAGESSQGVIGGSDAAGHTPEQLKTMREYQKATDSKLMEFIKKIITSPYSTQIDNLKYQLGNVTGKQAADIKQVAGVDTTGYARDITGKRVRHILKRHGEQGLADKSMADINDLGRIQYVLDNYDVIEVLGQTSNEYLDKHGNHAKMVRYGKQVDGHYYVVEAVPDTKKKTVHIVTAYQATNNQPDQQTPDAQRPWNTSQDESTGTGAPTIAQSQLNGNREIPRRMPVDGKLRIILPRAGESSQGVIGGSDAAGHTPLATRSIEEIAALARVKQRELIGNLNSIAQSIGGQIIDPGAKSIESMRNKVGRKQAAGRDYFAGSMKDHTRAAVLINDLATVAQTINAIKEKYPSLKGEAFIDAPLNRTGYRGIHLTVDMGNGINGEIQISTPQAWQIKRETDKIYQKWRNSNIEGMSPEERARYKADMAYSSRLWEEYYSGITPEVKRAASSAVMGLESISVPKSPLYGTQEPLENSSALKSSSSGKANNLSPSQRENVNIESSPSAPTIAQGQMIVNDNLPRRMLVDGKLRTILPRAGEGGDGGNSTQQLQADLVGGNGQPRRILVDGQWRTVLPRAGEISEGNPLPIAENTNTGLQRQINSTVSGQRSDHTQAGETSTGVEKNNTVLEYIPTSGIQIKATPGKTTTILGRYGPDISYIIKELGLTKSTDLGSNAGGFRVLNMPDDYYITAEQFWNEYNKPFIDIAIENGDVIYMVTPITNSNLYLPGSTELTGYGREYFYLLEHGYEYDNGMMIKR